MNKPVRTLLGSLAVLGALAATASAASAAVVINEVESDDPVVTDFVELTNTGAAPADISGYVIKDSDDGHAFTIPAATVIPAHGYYVADVNSGPGGFGLGAGDSARLFAPADLVHPVDSYSWTSHAAATYGRCPDGTGPMTSTSSSTRGAANDCPVPAGAWPGAGTVSTADGVDVFGQNLSGLAYQPSGSGAKGVLWAVRNGPSTLYRLIYDGTKWTPDTANGWGAGKQMVFPDGAGVPDAEGVTLAGGDANGIYVSIERNDDGPNSNTSRPAILRYDVSAAGATLTATNEWNLAATLPGLGANAGLEAVTWVPDDVLVAHGFFDEAAGAKYNPATHPDHGTGLFFAGVEQDGRIVAYALNRKTGAFTWVATMASGFPKVMELTYDPETTHLWAVCDDSCDGRTATLDIAPSGRFEPTHTYNRPGGMPNLNNEGFAIAPQAECVNGLKPVFWSDDSNTGQHALRTGAVNCTPLPHPQPEPKPPVPTPTPAADRTAPRLAIALKFTKAHKLRVRITLSERADVTMTATARKHTILKTTRRSVATGKRTFTLTSKRRLHRGEKVTLSVRARDAAGNATTRRVTAKVR
jgi:Lamin Tail Domain/Esterase-like activity of phytase